MRKRGLWLFLREFICHPKSVGASFPSSNKLAQVLAQQIPLQAYKTVVELGGGTGMITAGLLKHGISAEKLVIIERSAALTQHLHNRFPQLQIIQGDAQTLKTLLNPELLPIDTIVSSLPLRSLPNTIVKTIGEQVEQILTPNGLFIQFTYGLLNKPLAPSPNMRCIFSQYVWWNLPPARVDVFCKKP